MLNNDIILRRINEVVRMISKIVFNKDSIEYIYEDKENKSFNDRIHDELLSMISKGKINEAEDFLFDNLDVSNLNYVKVAMDFYVRINCMKDKELENLNFSRSEIKEGLEELLEIYDINFMKE
ncbi:MAG: DUF6483 family protein [Peptoniphilaceae bacterium]